jgi:hypothetical protein
MTDGVLKTKGTRLYFAVSETEILKVACATGIQGLGGAASQIDKTCLDSPEMEYEQGMRDPAPVSIPINFIPSSPSHQALDGLAGSGENISWMIVFSDQDTAPTTLDSDGHLESPGPTTVEFFGYVADMDIDVQNNSIVRATLTVQRSGAKTWDWPDSE